MKAKHVAIFVAFLSAPAIIAQKPSMTTGKPSAFGISPPLRDADDPGTDIGFHEGLRPQPTPPRGPGAANGGADTVAQRGHGSPPSSRRGAQFRRPESRARERSGLDPVRLRG